VEGNPDSVAPAPVALTTPPLLGYARINAGRADGGVYAPGAPMAVDLRVFAKGATALEMSWRLIEYGYDTPVEEGRRSVTFGREPFQDVPLTLAGRPDRDAYRLRLEIRRDGQVVDDGEYVLGLRTDFSRPRLTRQGLIRGREYVKRAAYFRTTFDARASRPRTPASRSSSAISTRPSRSPAT